MFKKIGIFIFLTSFLLAVESPMWLENDPDKNALYFRGASTWYVTADAITREKSQKDALHSAFAKISDYFGLNIKSTLEVKEEVHNGNLSQHTKSSIETKTNQVIFGLKPSKTYIEYNEDENNFRVHLLVVLDKQHEAQIRAKMKQDEKEYLALKKELIRQIELKNFFKAENILERAKGKRAAYVDDTLVKIEERLIKLKDGLLVANITLNKKKFLPNEEIEFEVSLNNKGYLYIFYDTGSDIEMLFPNKYMRKNYLNKEQLISFPNDDIEQVLAYEESMGLKTKIFAIASKKNLLLQRYKADEVDGVYIFQKSGKYRDIIKNCVDQASCLKAQVAFEISTKTDYKKVKIVVDTSRALQRSVYAYLQAKGIKSHNSVYSVVFQLKKQKSYSKLIGRTVIKFDVVATLFKGTKKLNRDSVQCDESDLNQVIKDIYIDFVENL